VSTWRNESCSFCWFFDKVGYLQISVVVTYNRAAVGHDEVDAYSESHTKDRGRFLTTSLPLGVN
jgi:hypothetical protein